MARVAFFDFDATLLDVNSGHLWVRHEWRRGRIGVPAVAKAAWWLGRYALGDTRLDHALHDAARIYAGLPAEGFRHEVQTWFDAELAHRARPGALLALARHREAGDLCVLATSSSQFTGACAAAAFDLDDAICTELEVLDGHLTGQIRATAFGDGKLHQARDWLASRGLGLEECVFYTDSYSDLALLEAVGEPVVVAPDRRLARLAAARGWRVAEWGRSA